MSFTEGIKGAYFFMEDKWYSFVDKISDKLPVFGKIVDGVEEKGIPSFPLAIVILIAIIFLIFFLAFASNQSLIVSVFDSNGNALSGAEVTVFLGNNIVGEQITNDNGQAGFSLAGEDFKVIVEKDGFVSQTRTYVNGASEEFTLSEDDVSLTKALTLKSASGELVTGSGIITYTCISTGVQKTGNYSNGIFNANFDNCTEIRVDNISGYNIITGTANFSGANNIILSKIEVETGTITIKLNVDSGEVPAGMRVTIRGEDGTPVETRTISEGTSIAVFEDIQTKKYYVTTHDPSGGYKDYDGLALGEIKELRKDETITYEISLEKSLTSTITVIVRDIDTSLPLEGAEVILAISNNNAVVDTEITGATGQIIFNVAEGSSYTITVEHPEYIIGNSQTVLSGKTAYFEMIQATEGNSQSLIASIIDTLGKPIDNVKVVLKKLDSTVVGEKTTGSDGKIEFYNLELTNYFVYAVKEGFDGVTSTAIQVLPRRQNLLSVTMEIGNGTIELNVFDETRNILNGANIKAINYFTNEIEEEQIADATGKAYFNIRRDKKVYFLISYPEYSNYYTTAFYPDNGSTIIKEIILTKSSDSLKINPIGVYLAGEEIGSERTVGPGVYTVKMTLEIPKGNFSEAGVHLRTGKASENVTNLMEEDTSKIGDVYTQANSVLRGTTFSPPNNYGVDSKNFTSGTAKWITAQWKNPKEGVYEVEAKLIIEDVLVNAGINLWYRGYAKGSSTLRDPQNNNAGNELYATAKNYLMTGGATNLCSGEFCKSYEMQTLSGSNAGRIQYITNKFNANKDNEYVLIGTITNQNAISGAVLTIDGKGIDLQSIVVNGVEREDIINLGNLSKDITTRIEIKYKVISSGTDNINLKLNSASKLELDEDIILSVKANKKISFDLIPKQIIPYINNTLFFETRDGNVGIKDAIIKIKLNENVIAEVETNSEGMAQYELSSPKIGDVLYITVSKEGFDTFEYEKEVDNRLVLVTPAEISSTITIGEVRSITEQIIVNNATVQKLKINKATINGEITSYIDTVIDSSLEGAMIESNVDANYNFTFKPNKTAQKLRGPKTVEGFIDLEIEVDGTNNTYVTKIPVEIRLTMPGYVDSSKCLKVNPVALAFNTTTKEVSQVIEIENNCSAQGINLNLHNLEVKLNQASKLGNINVSGSAFKGATVSETYTEISEFFKQGTESLTISFNPSTGVASGLQDLELIFRAKNVPEEASEEEITTKIKLDLAMSNVSQCIEVEEPTGGITLDVAGWNLGYSRIMTSSLSSYAQNYQGFSGRGQGQNSMPYGMNQALPFMSGMSNTEYEKNSFVIKNNCAVDIEIDLDPDSRIDVSEEKFTISADSDATIQVSPGYTLGKYSIGINAKVTDSEETKRKIDTVKVIVRRLGDIDSDCIKVNVSKIEFNSFLYQSKKYKVTNYCYDTGTYLNRSNAVSVQCDAPGFYTNPNSQLLMQVGQEQTYSDRYPLNTQMQSYSQYLQPSNGCGVNACHMVANTRTFDYRTIDSSSGTIEEVTFEVIPSSQYITQRKLFDPNANSYGLFQNLANIRQWVTETDGRTQVYGNLNVDYTNQYGSSQCMDFPVTIEDMWRITESIDSAINWGDPTARPGDCVGATEQENSLNIREYWNKKGQTNGEIPSAEFNSNGTYIYIAEPPAVKIGAATSLTYPTQSIYSQTQLQGTTGSNKTISRSKNCGLLDSISDIKYQNNFNGVILKVEAMGDGSLLNNTRGANLGVEINRNNIQSNCVLINTTVSAKLHRYITWEEGEVSWKLKALVLAPDFTPPAGFNPERDCIVTTDPTDDPSSGETNLSSCLTNPTEYGMNKVRLIDAKEMTNEIVDSYCWNNFCNNDMLQLFLVNKYSQIKEKLIALNTTEDVKLSELYKLAETTQIRDYNYYSQNDKFIKEKIKGIDYYKKDDKQALLNAIKGGEEGGIVAAITILTEIARQDTKKEIFVDSDNYALMFSLEEYIQLLKLSIDKNIGETITYANPNRTYKLTEENLKLLISDYTLVKLVRATSNPTAEEIQRVYTLNPILGDIHKLAVYDSKDSSTSNNLYLTAESEINKLTQETFSGFMVNDSVKSFTNEFVATQFIGPAKYKLTIDGNIQEIITKDNAKISINIAKQEDYNKSADNVILKNGFKLTTDNTLSDASESVIIKDNKFYTRAPVLITVNSTSQFNSFSYKPELNYGGTNLIKWNLNDKVIQDTKTGEYYSITTGGVGSQAYKGIYYYPENGTMIFRTNNPSRAIITAKGLLNNTSNTTRIEANETGTALQLVNLTNPTLKDVINYVNDGLACISNNGSTIIWNEKELTKNDISPQPQNTTNQTTANPTNTQTTPTNPISPPAPAK